MLNRTTTTRPFLGDDFLLETEAAQALYHDYARDLPIIDYHCHLPPQEIAEDKRFDNLTRIWLNGDHYKWRAMRTHGVPERFITGDADDLTKFERWAETVPYTMRNPLYHWTHLELQRYFDITDILNPDSARAIYEEATARLATPDYSVRRLLHRMNVEIVCTTDDPIDDLEPHRQIGESAGKTKVFPAFRPDRALFITNPTFPEYLEKLGEAAGRSISNWQELLLALENRIDYFHARGCRLSDHGLEQIYAADFTEAEVDRILRRRLAGQDIYPGEAQIYQSALLQELGQWYHARGWTQQFHLGALRNTNSRMMGLLGLDAGLDSIGDFEQARPLARLLDRLDRDNRLARTILYNLNPRDNELMATMIGNFNDGTIPGKIQYGSAWWFLDQKDGMEKQLNALSNMGLLSHFVGMLTDSRSFLSYPRHEYFRRILCNLFGRDIDNGELPNDIPWIGKLVQNICYYNAKSYFRFPE